MAPTRRDPAATAESAETRCASAVKRIGAAAVVFFTGALILPVFPTAAHARTEVGTPSSEERLIECLGGKAAVLKALTSPKPAAPKTLNEQIERIATWVEKERGLRFKVRPKPQFMTPAELRRKITKDINEKYSVAEATLDTALLSALGAIAPRTDLRKLQTDVLADQIAGFYDDETKDLVLITANKIKPLGPADQVTLAHELQHALADQVLGLPDTDNFSDRESDRELAAAALVEGDATLTMERYVIEQLSLKEMLALQGDTTSQTSKDSLDSVPHFLRESLIYPYTAGLEYVCALKAKGGWAAVNKAYSDLPASTLSLTKDDVVVTDPRDPGTLAKPWKQERTVGIGAADIEFLFAAPGGNTELTLLAPKVRASAWRGGEAVQWSNGTQPALGVSVDGLKCTSLQQWFERAYPKRAKGARRAGEVVAVEHLSPTFNHAAAMRCNGTNVRLGIAPDLTTARALVA